MIDRPRILVVDDDKDNRIILCKILQSKGYETEEAGDGVEALEVFNQRPFDLVLLDVMMPRMTGFEACQKIKESSSQFIPVILLTVREDVASLIEGFESGADEYLTKPYDFEHLCERVDYMLRLKGLQNWLDMETVGTGQVEIAAHSALDMTRKLVTAADFRNDETPYHLERIGQYSALIARKLWQDDDRLHLMRVASILHDVGKIGMPDEILLKRAPLTAEEFDLIKKHAVIGYGILSGSNRELQELAASIAWTHHEKFDGSGYPRGLSGDQIPIEGRIVAVAEVFDGLTSDRIYKPGRDLEEALDILRNASGSHLDPELVTLFLESVNEVQKLKQLYSENRD